MYKFQLVRTCVGWQWAVYFEGRFYFVSLSAMDSWSEGEIIETIKRHFSHEKKS